MGRIDFKCFIAMPESLVITNLSILGKHNCNLLQLLFTLEVLCHRWICGIKSFASIPALAWPCDVLNIKI